MGRLGGLEFLIAFGSRSIRAPNDRIGARASLQRGDGMEPMLVMQTAAVLLAISAAGGVVMALIRFGGKPHPPIALAMLHGFLSAAAATLLLYAAFTTGLPMLGNVALVLFLGAALGGVVLNLNYHWKALPLPKWLVLVHGAVAVVGFLCLLAAIFAAPGGIA
jgi:hypothetical protein